MASEPNGAGNDDEGVDYEGWRSHLTPSLRAKFEQIGEALVTMQVNDHRFSSVEKRKAAMVWLKEQRDRHKGRETKRFWAIFIIAALAFVASVVGIAVTAR